jgi:hypothetical protein
MSNVEVSPIRRAEDGGFQWTVLDPSYSPVTQRCNTNKEGRGLWRDGQQILGTSQFDLNCSPSARRARVMKFYS